MLQLSLVRRKVKEKRKKMTEREGGKGVEDRNSGEEKREIITAFYSLVL